MRTPDVGTDGIDFEKLPILLEDTGIRAPVAGCRQFTVIGLNNRKHATESSTTLPKKAVSVQQGAALHSNRPLKALSMTRRA
jgi:hypothetical protein